MTSDPTQTISGHIDLGHCQLAYERTGSGPHVVLIHGWPLSGRTWRNVVPHLTGLTVTVIDLPGFGKSTVGPDTPKSLGGMVGVVESALDEMDLGSCALMGHDSGGLIAREVAARRPDLVHRLVLMGTEIPDHKPLLLVMYVLLAKLPGTAGLLRFFMSSRLMSRSPFVLGSTFKDTSLINGEFRTELIEPLLTNDASMTQAVHLISNFSMEEVNGLRHTHTKLTMPSLLIWGDKDPFFPEAKARAMASQFAGETEFLTVRDARLFVHEEHPKTVGTAASEFLARRQVPTVS